MVFVRAVSTALPGKVTLILSPFSAPLSNTLNLPLLPSFAVALCLPSTTVISPLYPSLSVTAEGSFSDPVTSTVLLAFLPADTVIPLGSNFATWIVLATVVDRPSFEVATTTNWSTPTSAPVSLALHPNGATFAVQTTLPSSL